LLGAAGRAFRFRYVRVRRLEARPFKLRIDVISGSWDLMRHRAAAFNSTSCAQPTSIAFVLGWTNWPHAVSSLQNKRLPSRGTSIGRLTTISTLCDKPNPLMPG